MQPLGPQYIPMCALRCNHRFPVDTLDEYCVRLQGCRGRLHHGLRPISIFVQLPIGPWDSAHLLATDKLVIRSQIAELAVVEALACKGAKGQRRHEWERKEKHK